MAQLGVPHAQPAVKDKVALHKRRVGALAFLVQAMHLSAQLGILDVLVDDAHGDDHPQGLVLSRHKLRLKRTVEHILVHHILGNVKAAVGTVVVAAALARVEIEELKRAVALVVLNVKVGIAHKVKVLEQLAHAAHELVVGLGNDTGMVADTVGLMLLEQHMAQAHHAHLAVAVGIASEHAHVLVVAGHAILQDQIVGVAAGIRIANDLFQLGADGNLIGLLLALKFVLPPHDAVRRLQNHRVRKIDLVEHFGRRLTLGIKHRLGKGKRVRIGHAMLLAQLVEDLLLLALLEHAVGRVGSDDVIRQLMGILGLSHEGNIVIATAHKDNRLIGMRLGNAVDGFEHHGHGVDIHVGRVVDNLAAVRGTRLILAKDQTLDLVLLVEGARHRIGVDVATKQHGNELALCKLQCHGNFLS